VGKSVITDNKKVRKSKQWRKRLKEHKSEYFRHFFASPKDHTHILKTFFRRKNSFFSCFILWVWCLKVFLFPPLFQSKKWWRRFTKTNTLKMTTFLGPTYTFVDCRKILLINQIKYVFWCSPFVFAYIGTIQYMAWGFEGWTHHLSDEDTCLDLLCLQTGLNWNFCNILRT
jgi:hypothetical protein